MLSNSGQGTRPHVQIEIWSFVYYKKPSKDPFVMQCGVLCRLCCESWFWCMFLSAESAGEHLALSPWAKKCLCSLDWTNNTEFLESTEATSYRRKVDIQRWATKSTGRKKGGVQFCRMERIQHARYHCTCSAVFYGGGCIHCMWEENTGIREHCDGLISVVYATNTG